MGDTSNLWASFLAGLGIVISEFYAHLAPWLLFAAALVIVDLRFGIMAARCRGEEIRLSRAVRRTVNKAVDYLSWVTLAELASQTFGLVIGVPIVSMGTLLLIYGIEFNSCMNNYLEYKGIKGKFNVWRLMQRRDIEDAIEKDGEEK